MDLTNAMSMIASLTEEVKKELDMSGYYAGHVNAHRTAFATGGQELKFTFSEKILTWNQLCTRREQREALRLPECVVEKSALETMLMFRKRDPMTWKHGDKTPKGILPHDEKEGSLVKIHRSGFEA